MLKFISAWHRGVDNRLVAILELLNERIVQKAMNATETTGYITEAVDHSFSFIKAIATIDKSEKGKYANEKVVIKKRSRQYFEAGMRLDHLSVLNVSEIDGKTSTNTSTDVRASRGAYFTRKSRSSSDHESATHMRLQHVDGLRH